MLVVRQQSVVKDFCLCVPASGGGGGGGVPMEKPSSSGRAALEETTGLVEVIHAAHQPVQ